MSGDREVRCEHRFDNYAWNFSVYFTTCALLMCSHSAISVNSTNDGPYFADVLNNVTAPVGRDATFQCIIHDLKNEFRVAWFHKEKHLLLALGNEVILRNGRISVSSHAGTTFYLHIHDIREDDRGDYMCQINTAPIKVQIGTLQVVVPPRFIEELTSSDTEVLEDSSVSLRCASRGYPKPVIKWRREDNELIILQSSEFTNATKKVNYVEGEYINITKVTRLHMGAYICIANNGIPPAMSKRIFLGVNFSPLIWTPNQRVPSPLGSDVVLQCNLESHPHSAIQWMQSSKQIIINSDAKYAIKSIDSPMNPYKSEIRLLIRELKPSDYGTYTCYAKNSMGEAMGSILLYESPKSSTQSDLISFTSKDSSNGRKKYYMGTRSSVSFDDSINERGQNNKAILLTEVIGYEITSEHITLQSEDRATVNNRNYHENIASNRIINHLLLNINFLFIIKFLN